MGITAVCRMLVSCSHWVIHSVWLAALAVAICANVIFDYFQIQAADMAANCPKGCKIEAIK
jgi:hypothetical protein